ncbi:probable serine/threonine-protein kinase PBL7 [Chenopodium quinoa]|uniref:probable serine/threonine-protein kinase PBL7 n=1 Tax=Chenopodium quinoa TaxID=63459 RepID=UPI000B785E0B|nr:probable serine/threonine-protein kinase PBL7 [Chenopodium quinoa]
MSWYCCDSSSRLNKALKKINGKLRQHPSSDLTVSPKKLTQPAYKDEPNNTAERAINDSCPPIAEIYTYRQLADATHNFNRKCLVNVGIFGNVYRGQLGEAREIVAIEHLDRNGSRGDSEFDVQAMMLNLLNHPNVINLTGYCTRGNDRFLVHEYLPLGSLDKHLHDRSSLHTPTLDWHTRTRIALGTANALEYLHNKANPPVIYRNLKPCNILLDNDYNAKLSDFSLSKFGPICDKEHVSVRVRGTFGYIAPEYVKRGFLSVKADVYNFGIVLLELLTGRRAVDIIRETKDQELSYWANRMVLKKSKKILELADPLLQGNFPSRSFYQTFAVAAMCLVENLTARPMMSDVVAAISYISSDCNLDNTNNSPLHEA